MVLKGSYTDGFFNISPIHGFLPVDRPLTRLPSKYMDIQKIIDKLPVYKSDTGPGILGREGEIQKIVNSDQLTNHLDNVVSEKDTFIIQALFRAYTFLVSSYTLEPAYAEFMKTGEYGKGINRIPEKLSKPLVYLSNRLGVYPWLDYHYAYSLGNYIKRDPSGTFDWKNLKMACSFAGTRDEIGFIMLHVYINELTPKLLSGIHDIVFNGKPITGLADIVSVATGMNERRREMWIASNPSRYNDFRIFIMGIKGNKKIFGDGLIYEGEFDDEPQQFRGQTGAQDDIIPTLDIVSGITKYYPDNYLTRYLMELREYRPPCMREFLTDLHNDFSNIPLMERFVNDENWDGLILLWQLVDQIYQFRNGHWQFVQKYIMANTKYDIATGGTPVTLWIPNQIEACLKLEQDIMGHIREERLSDEHRQIYDKLSGLWQQKTELLHKQVGELQKKNGSYDVKLVWNLNQQLGLADV